MSKRSSDRNDKSEDNPPMSRLFIICSKNHTEEEFQEAFQPFGDVEEIYMVKDRHTGEKKGVCYVKFSKTSEAAKALEALNGKPIGPEGRSIKVVVASSRDKGNKRYADEEERYLRLFVIIPKEMTEDQLRDEFSNYGNVTDITILHSKNTKDGKCFAYIKFKKFSDTANAFECCDPKYKAVFAEPKPSKNDRDMNMSSYMNSYNDLMPMGRSGGGSGLGLGPMFDRDRDNRRMSDDLPHYGMTSQVQETTLSVICSPLLTQDQLWRLFDIIPGLDYCRLHDDMSSGNDLFSFGGSRGGGGGGDRDLPCNIPLPSQKPMAPVTAPCRKRLFIVCTNGPLPAPILKNAFCRFGDLIEVFLLPGKNCGYALFANEASAEDCMTTLHGAEIAGIRLKAMEADEPNQGRKRLRQDDN
uniref:CSON007493 protein n=1 Tax=Culicoides sonorensis TaxID=179676 RepID=A0A336M0D8_CULSO